MKITVYLQVVMTQKIQILVKEVSECSEGLLSQQMKNCK